MKNILILFLFFSTANIVLAQEETLLSGDIESGGYGALITKIGPIKGTTAVFMGAQAGWIINHRIGLGAKGYGMINVVEEQSLQNVKLEFGCWGGLLEYIIASDKLLHVNINTLIGAGTIKYSVIDYQDPSSPFSYSDDGFFVLEPGAIDYIEGDSTVWEREPMENLAQDGMLTAYRHHGYWQNMDTLRDKNLLEELWQSGKAPWKIW